MTARHFNSLGYQHQTEAVLTGTFLADRFIDCFYVRLYNLESFYVEAYFDALSNLITHFKAFDKTILVMSYLAELKIVV